MAHVGFHIILPAKGSGRRGARRGRGKADAPADDRGSEAASALGRVREEARERGIPLLVFVNKIDRGGGGRVATTADGDEVLEGEGPEGRRRGRRRFRPDRFDGGVRSGLGPDGGGGEGRLRVGRPCGQGRAEGEEEERGGRVVGASGRRLARRCSRMRCYRVTFRTFRTNRSFQLLIGSVGYIIV